MSKTNKVKLLVFLAIIAAAIILPNKVFAGTYGSLTYEVGSDNKVSITDCNESATSVTIPSSIGGYPVTKISWYAFQNCKSLKSVSIPTSVTEIKYNAFQNCTALSSITIPNSVTELGDNAFSGCTSLKSVSLSSNITEINYYTFSECTSLSSITIPSKVKTISYDAFKGCTALKSVVIPNNVENMYDSVFEDCTSLSSVTLSNKVTYIPSDTFLNCKSLTSITIPNSVTSIGYGAFGNCTSLKSVNIPNKVEYISGSFYGCTNLTKVVIPSSVTDIYNNSFKDCNNVKLWVQKNSEAYKFALNNDISYYVPLNANVANVRATSQTQNSVNLKWNTLANATGYRVYVYNYSTKKWTTYGNTSKNYMVIKSLNAGQSYAVKIRAFYRSGNTVLYSPGYSTTIAVATKPPYTKKIKTTVSGTKVNLSWSASRGATGYLVYISNTESGGYKLATRSNTTSATVTGLTKGKTYYIKVRPYKRLSTTPVQYVYGYFGNAVKVTI